MSPAVITLIVLPVFLWWAETWADRPSDDELVFRPVPPFRIIYPGALVLFGWILAYYGAVMIDPKQYLKGGDWLGLTLGLAFLITNLATWPATVKISEKGLYHRRLFIKRFMSWHNLSAVIMDLDGRLIIYGRTGESFEVSRFTQGRQELKLLLENKVKG